MGFVVREVLGKVESVKRRSVVKKRRRQMEMVDCAFDKRDLEGERRVSLGLSVMLDLLSWENNTRSILIPMPLLLLLLLMMFGFVTVIVVVVLCLHCCFCFCFLYWLGMGGGVVRVLGHLLHTDFDDTPRTHTLSLSFFLSFISLTHKYSLF